MTDFKIPAEIPAGIFYLSPASTTGASANELYWLKKMFSTIKNIPAKSYGCNRRLPRTNRLLSRRFVLLPPPPGSRYDRPFLFTPVLRFARNQPNIPLPRLLINRFTPSLKQPLSLCRLPPLFYCRLTKNIFPSAIG